MIHSTYTNGSKTAQITFVMHKGKQQSYEPNSTLKIFGVISSNTIHHKQQLTISYEEADLMHMTSIVLLLQVVSKSLNHILANNLCNACCYQSCCCFSLMLPSLLIDCCIFKRYFLFTVWVAVLFLMLLSLHHNANCHHVHYELPWCCCHQSPSLTACAPVVTVTNAALFLSTSLPIDCGIF